MNKISNFKYQISNKYQYHIGNFKFQISNFCHRQAGFTIVELLTVVAIIGILAAGIMATLDPVGQIQKGRDAKRKEDLRQIRNALEVYYQDYGYYPPQCTTSDYRILNGAVCVDWGASFTPYMEKISKDEDKSRSYRYVAAGTKPQKYYLYASLQRGKKDPQVCKTDGSACANVPVSVTCGSSTAVCNYGLSSPNTTP